MRRFLLVLLFAPALAVAQPTAADSALVDRAMAALGVFDSPLGDADDIRAAFFEDYRADLLEEAVAVLESPIYTRIEGPPGQRLRPTDRDARHDSTLIADYVIARSEAVLLTGTWPQALAEARRTLSDAPDRALAEVGVWETLSEPMRVELPSAIAMSRFLLSAVPPSEIEALTVYFRSEAGRYVGRRVALGNDRHSAREAVASLVQALER